MPEIYAKPDRKEKYGVTKLIVEKLGGDLYAFFSVYIRQDISTAYA